MPLHFSVMWKWCLFASASASASRKIWIALLLPPMLPCFQSTSKWRETIWAQKFFLTGFNNQDLFSQQPSKFNPNFCPHNLKIITSISKDNASKYLHGSGSRKWKQKQFLSAALTSASSQKGWSQCFPFCFRFSFHINVKNWTKEKIKNWF